MLHFSLALEAAAQLNAPPPLELLRSRGQAYEVLGDFESEVSRRIEAEAGEAWNVSYQAVTPQWASWSAVRGSRIVYQRMTMLCDGTSYGAFRAEYSVTDSTVMDPMIDLLVASLRGNC